MRIPAGTGEYRRAELRSPDPGLNPYIAFSLMIYAGLDGIENKRELPIAANCNLYKADAETLAGFKQLPQDWETARRAAENSAFIREHLPAAIVAAYCRR